MNRLACIAVLGALMVHYAFAQTVHIVGDSIGWDVPPNGAATYTNWASGKTFVVGDTLVFNFVTNSHDVQQVPKASFDACTSENAIGDVILNGPANVTLSSAGEHYYICTIGRHCQAGQKLTITVSASGAPGASPPMTTPPSTPSRPVTPSPTSNEPDACAPTPSPSPSSSMTPTAPAAGITPPPPPSSSTAVFASLAITLVSIIATAAFL